MDRKRQWIGVAFLSVVLLSLLVLGYKIGSRKAALEEASENTRTLSRISARLGIPVREFLQPTLLLYVNSECEHCHWQLNELVKAEGSLVQAQVILVSIEPLDSLNAFLRDLPFQNAATYQTYEIDPEHASAAFGSTGTPQTYIYRENQLTTHFKGEVRVGLITASLNTGPDVTQKAE